MRSLMIGLMSCTCATTALAAPMTMTWQGRVLDNVGTPIDGGSHTVTIELWPSQTETDPLQRLHVEQFVGLAPDGGYVSVQLGTEAPLDSGVFANPQVWTSVSVDGTPLGERTMLTSVPLAARSIETTRFAASSAPCDGSVPSDLGLVRFNGAEFEGCTDNGWRSFSGNPIGANETDAALSCSHIRTVRPTAPDGDYWLDPDGSGAFLAYCDMQNGGWTLVARMTVASGMAHYNTGAVAVSGNNPVSNVTTSTQKFSDARINAIRVNSPYAGSTAYKMTCWEGTGDFATMYCSSACSFSATASIGTSECSRCTGSFEGSLVQLQPNSGTRGLGHHHDDTYPWSMAYQRPPEQSGQFGCRNDAKGSGDGRLWVR